MINPSFHCFLGLWLPSPNVFWEPKYFSFFSVCEAFRKNKGPLCAGLLQDDMIYSQFMKASGRFLQRRKWCFIFSVCLCERRLWSWCEQWRPPEKSATCHQRKSRLKKKRPGNRLSDLHAAALMERRRQKPDKVTDFYFNGSCGAEEP